MSDKGLDETTQEFGENHFGEGEEGVGNDRETMPFSSSNKRIKEMPIDPFSKLPDSLLIHILSFLGVEKAAVTSVLSKRWKFLWAELPTLEFWESTGKKPNFVSWVNKTLDLRKGSRLENFFVRFKYNKCFAPDVDAWFEFAVKNKVKELVYLTDSYSWGGDYHTLPHIMYSCSTLMKLSLEGCIMAPERTIEWQSLTGLYLSVVELNQLIIDDILSNCPVLYTLKLERCWGFNRLEVNSPSLHRLTIEDCGERENAPLLEISAPYLHTLNISLYPKGRKLKTRNISSLVIADIDLEEHVEYPTSEEVMSNAEALLENFRHVKELSVSRQCFEVISTMAANGRHLPQSMWRRLEVVSCSDYENSISGILALLESSPNLETLCIEGYETDGEYFTLDPAAKDDLDGDLLHLKTIKVENFADPKGEPMLTLAQILLKRATVLEKMVIRTDVEVISDFANMAQKLLTYPRSSEKAVILLS